MGKTTKGHGNKGSDKPDENVSGVKANLLKLFQRASHLEAKMAVYDLLLTALQPYIDEDSFLETPKGNLVKVVPREVMIDVKTELANKRIDLLTEYNEILNK